MINFYIKFYPKKNNIDKFKLGNNDFSEVLLIENIMRNEFPLFFRVFLKHGGVEIPNYVKINHKFEMTMLVRSFSSSLDETLFKKYVSSYLHMVFQKKNLYNVVKIANVNENLLRSS